MYLSFDANRNGISEKPEKLHKRYVSAYELERHFRKFIRKHILNDIAMAVTSGNTFSWNQQTFWYNLPKFATRCGSTLILQNIGYKMLLPIAGQFGYVLFVTVHNGTISIDMY